MGRASGFQRVCVVAYPASTSRQVDIVTRKMQSCRQRDFVREKRDRKHQCNRGLQPKSLPTPDACKRDGQTRHMGMGYGGGGASCAVSMTPVAPGRTSSLANSRAFLAVCLLSLAGFIPLAHRGDHHTETKARSLTDACPETLQRPCFLILFGKSIVSVYSESLLFFFFSAA